MAKDKKSIATDVVSPDAEDDQYSSFFQAEMDEASKVMGRHNVLVGRESERRKYGIEIPSLALQHVLQSNVLFMESLMLVAGREATHKTSFAFEIARWVLRASGFARIFDTEGGKVSPLLAKNLIGADLVGSERRWRIMTCESMNVWQETCSNIIRKYRETFIEGKGLKKAQRRPPLMAACMVIDSLTGRTTEQAIGSFEKEGKFANTQGAWTAKAISDWLQSQSFLYLPWYFIMIRHEKAGGISQTFATAAKQKSTPGGKAPDFLGGYDLRFSVIDRHRLADRGYNAIRMKCNKNAFGVDKHQCDVRFSWTWMDTGADEPEQIPRWEWDLATAQLLAHWEREDLKDICHMVESGTKPDPLYNCRQLGLRGVSGQEVGQAVRLDSRIYRELQDYLHIQRWPIFDPHMDLPEVGRRAGKE